MKVTFEMKQTYTLDIVDDVTYDNYGDIVDYVSKNCYDLIDNGEAKCVSEGLLDVNIP